MPLARPVKADEILAVIPALNEERHIARCIRSLMTGEAALRSVPLIVADGGSSDRTADIVRALSAEFPNLLLMHNPQRLQSAAINLAAASHADPTTRYLVRCDAHSVYPPNFILDVAAALAKTGAASVVVPMDAIGETCFERANAWIVDTLLGSGGAAHRGGRVSGYVDHGHHAGFDLAWFNRIGGYDPTFSHNEDAEYDTRLAAAGGRIYLDAGIRIGYVPRGSVGGLARQYFNYGKGRARTLRKHRSRPKLRQLIPVVAFLTNLIALAVSPWQPVALVVPMSYLAILAGASVAMTVQRRSACGLMSGLASGTMHMSWAAGFLRGLLLPQEQRHEVRTSW